MSVRITYYLDIVSSWCYWAEPAWAELKQRYAEAPVEFGWKIALLDGSGMSKSKKQLQWFYRRSGPLVRSPFMLNPGWFDPKFQSEYLAANCVAEAAKDLGITDDQARLSLMHAAMREGKKVADWNVCAAVAAERAQLDRAALLAKAKSKSIEKRVRASTAEFHSFQSSRRPTFVLESSIADRAVFSGIWKAAPIAAAMDAMLDDVAAYTAHAAHFGSPPSK
jgi:predicted DsbA family dithiol-disulfide isomerase